MTSKDRRDRILAVDTRAHWLGFAVFTPPAQLLDFGLFRFFYVARREIRFIRLVKMFRPRLVLMGTDRDHRGALAFQQSVVHVSREFSIPVTRVNVRSVRRYLDSLGVRNKQEAATLLARQFPELSWRVPPPRRRWQHEHQNMPIFDAVAIGLTHLHRDDRS